MTYQRAVGPCHNSLRKIAMWLDRNRIEVEAEENLEGTSYGGVEDDGEVGRRGAWCGP